MTDKMIATVALFYMYYHIGGLATTNILRLTKGNTSPVLSSRCVCDNCGMKISVIDQFPVTSYIFCKGRCRHCGVKIPLFPLCLELTVMLGMMVITALFRISGLGVTVSFAYYEIVRIVTIRILGPREQDFARQYVIAVLMMFVYWLLALFVALIYRIV